MGRGTGWLVRLLLGVLVFVSFAVLLPDFVSATHVECSTAQLTILTGTTTLDSDLVLDGDRFSTCLYLDTRNAPAVLDCAGHSISLALTPGNLNNHEAIAIMGTNPATIKNCVINTFRTGMVCRAGLFCGGGGGDVLESNIFTDVQRGILFGDPYARNSQTIKNNIFRNADLQQPFTAIVTGIGGVIEFNRITSTDVGHGIFCGSGSKVNGNYIFNYLTGISCEGGGTQITSNLIDGYNDVGNGIALSEESGTLSNLIKSNTIRNNRIGIVIAGAENTWTIIDGNTIEDGVRGLEYLGFGNTNLSLITKNYIRNNFDSGQQTGGVYISQGRIELRNNVICGNGPYDVIQNPWSQGFGSNNACSLSSNWNEGNGGCTYKCGTLEGFVTDGHKYSEDDSGHTNSNELHPLRDAKITLQLRRDPFYFDITNFTSKDGRYLFYTPFDPSGRAPNIDARLKISLVDKRGFIEVYKWDQSRDNPVYFSTKMFSIDSADKIKDINALEISKLDDAESNIIIETADDLSNIYFHTKEAADFASDILRLSMDHAMPVQIYAFTSPLADEYKARYCITASSHPECSHISPYSSIISIVWAASLINEKNKPSNLEWHEFSHHVMVDSLIGGDNDFPPIPSGTRNHGRFENPTTADS